MVNTAPPSPYRLRAMSLAELLDEAIRLYRRSFGLFAGLALAVTLPGLAMSLMSGSYRSVGWLTKFLQNLGNQDALHQLLQTPPPQSDPTISLLASLVRLVLVPISLGVIIYTANELLRGNHPTILQALEGTLERYWALAGMALLIGILVFAGVLLITIPIVIWAGIRFIVGVPALIAERLRPAKALGRSWGLVEGRWWWTLGIVCVVWLMYFVALEILSGMAGVVIGLLPGLGDDLRGGLILVASSIAGAMVFPVPYIALTLLYYDLRVRREGADLDQLARQAQPPSAA